MAERWYIYGWHKVASDATVSEVSVLAAETVLDAEPGTVAGELVPGDRGIDSDHVMQAEC